MRTFDSIMEFATLANMYIGLRRKHPRVPANQVKEYLDSQGDETFAEFLCGTSREGHVWSSGYAEDADGYEKEVPTRCIYCGRSGDI